jgi:hypothetical protein
VLLDCVAARSRNRFASFVLGLPDDLVSTPPRLRHDAQRVIASF